MYPQIWNRLLHGFSKKAVDFWSEGFPAEGGSPSVFSLVASDNIATFASHSMSRAGRSIIVHPKDDLLDEKLSVRQVLKMIWDLQVFFRFVWFFQGPTKTGPLACDRPQHGNRNHETCGLEMRTDGKNLVGISEPEKQKWIYTPEN